MVRCARCKDKVITEGEPTKLTLIKTNIKNFSILKNLDFVSVEAFFPFTWMES